MSDAAAAATPPTGEEEFSLRPGGGIPGGNAPPGLSLRPGGGMNMGSFGLMTAPTRTKKVMNWCASCSSYVSRNLRVNTLKKYSLYYAHEETF